jgi:hypothetical protein
MKSYSANQNAVAASQFKRVYWLFEFNDMSNSYKWSTQAVPDTVYNSTAYSFKIIPKSFTGISLERSKIEENMFAPSTTSFIVTNKDNTLSADIFEGELLTIRLVVSNGTLTEEMGTWIFNVNKCIDIHQTLEFECVDPVTYVIDGDYPKNREVSTISPSVSDPRDDLCLPEVFGTAYIPIRSQFIGDSSTADRYYFLGTSDRTFTIDEVRSPRETGFKSLWVSTGNGGDYTMSQSTPTIDGQGYRVFQPIIDDSDNDGTPDACGVWPSGNGLLDMPTKFERTDGLHPLSNPADVIEYILEDMGVDPSIIDSAGTFASAASTYTSWGLDFNGGIWKKHSREFILAMLLNMCHSTLQFTDKIELHVLVKASQKTITSADILRTAQSGYGTFKTDKLTEITSDSGHIEFQPNVDTGESQDLLVKYTVPAKATTNDISSQVLSIPFVTDSQDAKRIGSLYFQRKLLKKESVNFQTKATLLALQPDDFITINDALYGGNYIVLVDTIDIDHELSMKISGTSFSDTMDDWGDISPDALTIADEQPSGWQPIIVGPDATVTSGQIPNALAGRIWVGNAINIDPTTVNITVFEPDSNFTQRVNIGQLQENDYGIEIKDTDGIAIFSVNSTGSSISGWSFDQNRFFVSDSSGTFIELNATNGYIAINNTTFGDSGFQVQHNSGSPRLYIGDGADVYLKYENGSLDISGSISASTGTIGGFTVSATQIYSGTDIVIDSADKYIAINDITFGNLGFQVQYNSGAPRLYIGDGSNNYLKYENGSIRISRGELIDSVIGSDPWEVTNPPTPMVHYRFDESTGLTAADTINGYNGTLEALGGVGDPWPTDNSQWVVGQKNNALDFSTSSGRRYVNTNRTFISVYQNSFSLSMWLNISYIWSGGNNQLFGSSRTSGVGYPFSTFSFAISGAGKLYAHYNVDNYAPGQWTTYISDNVVFDGPSYNNWQHVVVVVQNNVNIHCFFNGALLDADSVNDGDMSGISMTNFIASFATYIGNLNVNDTPNYGFYGKIDEFRWYNRALSSAEVTVLYNYDR